MIDFNKNTRKEIKPISKSRIVKTSRRVSLVKKITKTNLDFLRALGFKT